MAQPGVKANDATSYATRPSRPSRLSRLYRVRLVPVLRRANTAGSGSLQRLLTAAGLDQALHQLRRAARGHPPLLHGLREPPGPQSAVGGLMGISEVTLSLLIALLSILGTVVLILREAFAPDRAETRLRVVGIELE